MKTTQQSYPALARAIGISGELFLKREDLHPYGSHKGRAIPKMIKQYVKDGISTFAISSSGNAALAAKLTVERHNENNPDKQISLTIFVGTYIPAEKFAMLKSADEKITVTQCERPKQQAFVAAKVEGVVNLRQSTDDLALEGYQELGTELLKIPTLSAVFVPTSSGTTAEALGKLFANNNIELHIVQTGACHPMAELFDTNITEVEQSTAGAIVDNVAHRKTTVADLVKQTSGNGWVPTEEMIIAAQHILKSEAHIDVTPNGALALAGLIKATEKGFKTSGAVAVLICGQ